MPRTTITNNPEAVEKLFDEVDHERVIFKSLTPLFLPPDKLLYTTEITREFPSRSQSSIAQCPAIFQELVERKSDLRITVVGREMFVARIASQILDEQKDRLDWRRCQDKEELYSEAQVHNIVTLQSFLGNTNVKQLLQSDFTTMIGHSNTRIAFAILDYSG